MKKVAGYYRISMEDDDCGMESNSITNQRALIKKFVLHNDELNGQEYCEFYDDGYSGTTMNRPGLKEMLRRIQSDEIGTVIVKDISRFSRDYIELGTYIEKIFPYNGVRFISVTDHYDSKECSGTDMCIAIKGLLADFYCKDVSCKVKSSLAARRKKGIYSTGLTPFGYEKDIYDPHRLVVVSEEAEIVRHIFGLYASGMNMSQICRKLNDEGVRTPLEFKNARKKQNGKELQGVKKQWQAGTVKSILTNENYIGNMVYEKTRQTPVGSGRKVVIPKSEWKIYYNHHKPIVEKSLFDEVQKIYRERGNKK